MDHRVLIGHTVDVKVKV